MSSAGPTTPSASLVRAMGRWTLVALVLNSIIGSGIFGLPASMAAMLGDWAVPAYLIAGLANAVVMICFAEVASRFTGAGGAYLYTREAMGRFAGIQIGWMSYLVRLTSCAAGANLFVVYLAEFWPAAATRGVRAAIVVLLLGLLAAINVRGVKAGARMSNIFTAAKLVPLLAFVALGAWYLGTHGGTAPPSVTITPARWVDALLLLAFAYGGFEGAMMPLAEARDPRRDAPFALIVAAFGLIALYAVIQYVCSHVLVDPAASPRPLAAAARLFIGDAGAILMTAGAVISIYGFLTANMLNVPRLTFALAERRDFPAPFARVHARFSTPWFSIVVFAALMAALTLYGSFEWNAILSGVARLINYGVVCAALLVLRRSGRTEPAFRLPAAPVWAVVGILITGGLLAWFLYTRPILNVAGLLLIGTVAVATVNWAWVRRKFF